MLFYREKEEVGKGCFEGGSIREKVMTVSLWSSCWGSQFLTEDGVHEFLLRPLTDPVFLPVVLLRSVVDNSSLTVVPGPA